MSRAINLVKLFEAALSISLPSAKVNLRIYNRFLSGLLLLASLIATSDFPPLRCDLKNEKYLSRSLEMPEKNRLHYNQRRRSCGSFALFHIIFLFSPSPEDFLMYFLSVWQFVSSTTAAATSEPVMATCEKFIKKNIYLKLH